MISAVDPDPELDYQLFGDSGSRFESSKNGKVTPKSVMIPALDPDPELDFQPFGNS